MMGAESFPAMVQAAFTAVLVWAMASDLIRLEIPDGVHVAILALFGCASFQTGIGWADILWHLVTAATLFLGGAMLFALGIWGGGDVKLAAVVGLWLGMSNVLSWLLLVSLFGGVLALLILILRAVDRRLAIPAVIRLEPVRTGGVPYGVALAAAAMVMLPSLSCPA